MENGQEVVISVGSDFIESLSEVHGFSGVVPEDLEFVVFVNSKVKVVSEEFVSGDFIDHEVDEAVFLRLGWVVRFKRMGYDDGK